MSFDPDRLRSTDKIEVIRTDLPEVVVLQPIRRGDARGFFHEAWNRRDHADLGLSFDFVQDNFSWSPRPFTVRGLHYQAPPAQQTKLVSVPRGRILDVVVDARQGSPNFGRWISIELSFENGRQIVAPRGFLHGVMSLEPDTAVTYKSDAYFSPAHDGAVAWDDPDLAIAWGVPDGALAPLSVKDASAPRWRDWDNPFLYGENS